jgi:hypothetical protein
MQMLLLSPESVVVYNNKVLWDPLLLLLLPSFFPLANSKGKKEGRLDLDITWLIRNAKNKRGQVVGLLVCCLFVTSCVLFWEKSLLD